MTHRENSAIMQAGYHIIQQATYICTHQKAEACHCPQLPNMKQHGMLEQVHKISFDYPLTISIDVYRIISPASAYVKKMATAIPLLTNFWGKCNSHPLSRLAEFPGFLKWRQRNRKRPPKKGLRIKETNLRSWRKTKLAKGHSFCKSAMGIYGFHHQIEGFKPRILRYDVLPYGKKKSTELRLEGNLLNVWKVFEQKKQITNMFGCGFINTWNENHLLQDFFRGHVQIRFWLCMKQYHETSLWNVVDLDHLICRIIWDHD